MSMNPYMHVHFFRYVVDGLVENASQYIHEPYGELHVAIHHNKQEFILEEGAYSFMCIPQTLPLQSAPK